MVHDAKIDIERHEGRKRSSTLWIVVALLVGIGIGYAIHAIQDWLFA
jgi:hypothetical protein